MNKSDVKSGQTWKSKLSYPGVGYYTVEILGVGQNNVLSRFTASEWEDGHWVEDHVTTISNLLDSYELQ